MDKARVTKESTYPKANSNTLAYDRQAPASEIHDTPAQRTGIQRAIAGQRRLAPVTIMAMQQTVGNRAVQRILEPPRLPASSERQAQTNSGRASGAVVQRAGEYEELEEDEPITGFGFEPNDQDKARAALEWVHSVQNNAQYTDLLLRLQEALDIVKPIKETDVGKKIYKPLETSADKYFHYVEKVTTAASRLGNTMSLKSPSERTLRDQTQYLERQVTKLVAVVQGVESALAKSQEAISTYKTKQAKQRMDKDWERTHPREALVFSTLERANTVIGVALGIAGTFIGLPGILGIVKGGLSAVVSVAKTGVKKYQNREEAQDAERLGHHESLIDSGMAESDVQGLVEKGGKAVGMGVKAGLKAADFFGAPLDNELVKKGLDKGIEGATKVGSKLAEKYDADKNEKLRERGDIGLGEIADALEAI